MSAADPQPRERIYKQAAMYFHEMYEAENQRLRTALTELVEECEGNVADGEQPDRALLRRCRDLIGRTRELVVPSPQPETEQS